MWVSLRASVCRQCTALQRNDADAVAAKSQNYHTTIYNAKRFIGRAFTDDGVERDAADHPFRVVAGKPLGKDGAGDIYFDVKVSD